MKERTLVARRWVALGLLGAALVAVVIVCTREPDLRRLSVRQLVDLAPAKFEPLDFLGDSLEQRAFGELRQRPRAELDVLARALVIDPLPKRRMLAASLLGGFLSDAKTPLAGAALQECEARLIALLDDRDEGVRVNALKQLALWWREDPARDVPAAAMAVVRELLVATSGQVRFDVALSAFQLGPHAAVVVPEMLAALARETDFRVRWMLVGALGRTRTQAPAVIDAVIRLLDDSDAKMHYAAAASLGELAPAAGVAIPRLRALLVHVDEEKDARSAAASALAKLVVTAVDAEAVLGELLGQRQVYSKYEQGRWIMDVGRLARVVPDRQAAKKASKVLVAAAEESDEDVALFATAELLRLAVARGDASLPAEQLTKLATALASITEGMASDPPYVFGTAEPVLDAFVDLASHPQGVFDRAAVVAALDNVAARGEVWERGWAKKQLARLR